MWLYIGLGIIVVVAITIGLYFALRPVEDVVFFSEENYTGKQEGFVNVDKIVSPVNNVVAPFVGSVAFNIKSVKFNKTGFKVDIIKDRGIISATNPTLLSLTTSGNVPATVTSMNYVISKQ